MITYINNLIGTTYEQEPILYILCFMLIIWFIYNLFGLIYVILGVNK